MAGQVTTLFSDSAKTNELYPRTKTSAVSDADGNTLGDLAVYNAVTVGTGVNAVKTTLNMDLLWENEAPTSNFSAQTITGISVNSYSLIYLLFRLGTSSTKTCTVLIESSNRNQFYALIVDGSARAYRMVTLGDSSVVYDSSYQGSLTADVSVKNQYVIPYAVYGIK